MDTGIDPQQVAQKLVEANNHGEAQLALACVVLLCVFLARKFGPKLPGKLGAFFGSGFGGMVLAFAIGQGGAVVTALEAGTPFSLRLVLSGIVVSLLGSGMHAQVKQVKQSRTKKAASSPATAVIILTFFSLASGCACFRPADPAYNSKECVVARKAIDCTKGSIVNFVLAVGPALAAAIISGAPIDLDAIAAQAEKGGIGNGMCILAALESDLTKPGASPKMLVAEAKTHSALTDLAHKLYGPGPVDVKIKRVDGSDTTLVVQ